MKTKYILLLGMISALSEPFAASAAECLTEQTATDSSPYRKECLRRLASNSKFHAKIRGKFSNQCGLDSSNEFRFVGMHCAYSIAVEEFLLTLGARVLEQPSGTYLALGAGTGYFEDSVTMLFPEFSQWHKVLTDAVPASVEQINDADETFVLDVNKLEAAIAGGPLNGKTFDVVSIQNVLQFLSENERTKCLHTLSKLLKPNGVILLSFERWSIQRCFRKQDAYVTMSQSIENKQPGVYCYQISISNGLATFLSEQTGPDLRSAPDLLSNPILQRHLKPLPNIDDLSVQDAIVMLGSLKGSKKVFLHRGMYPHDLPKANQIIEFVLVFKKIDFDQFPEVQVVQSQDGVKYNSLTNTRLSNILIKTYGKDDKDLIPWLMDRTKREREVKPHGVFYVLKKR